QGAYNRTGQEHRGAFIDLLNDYTPDSMAQIQKHQGIFIVAEMSGKVVGISVGCPYGKSALSEKYIQRVYESKSQFKEVMANWWNVMAKFEGTPPGKVYHQATMAIDPEFAG